MRTEPRGFTRVLISITLGGCLLALVIGMASRGRPTPDVPGTRPELVPQVTVESGSAVIDARPARRTGAVQPEAPSSIRLPTGTLVPIRAASTRADGLLDVPDDIRLAGWWRGGSRVGDPLGSTLLAAHVDGTEQGLGPYASLLEVRRNQRFVVASANLQQTFRATSLRILEQGSLLRHPWIYSATGDRRLVMVTCAPPYVPARGGYQNLAVVTAVPVSAPTSRER